VGTSRERGDAAVHHPFVRRRISGDLLLLALGRPSRPVSEDERRDFAVVLERLDEEKVERLFLPYVALQHLAELSAERGMVPRALREVQTAGEQLRITAPIRQLFSATGATLSNQYGPSETHVATAAVVRGAPKEWPLLPNIGGPIANARCYVLDRAGEPSPVGAATSTARG
jgi:non-ribosomal peptide synthetase component F